MAKYLSFCVRDLVAKRNPGWEYLQDCMNYRRVPWITPLCFLVSGSRSLHAYLRLKEMLRLSPLLKLLSPDGSQSLVSRFGQRKKKHFVSAFVDRGEFDPNVAGGVARSKAKCCALPIEDIVVSLQVYIVDCPKEPIIEILQFEKLQDRDQLSDHEHKDPYGNLLKWLILLDNTIFQQPRSLPPPISSIPGISSTAHKPSLSSGS